MVLNWSRSSRKSTAPVFASLMSDRTRFKMPLERAAVGKSGEGIEIGKPPHRLIAVADFRNHAIECVNQNAGLVVGFVFNLV